MPICRSKIALSRPSHEVERASSFFNFIIMICAFLPLFTMQGPEGQIFGPMAQTYAFALGGALLLAITAAPPCVCCFSATSSRGTKTFSSAF